MLLVALSANADLYRWVDDNGKVSYSDKKPSDTENVERSKLVVLNKSFLTPVETSERPQPILKSYEKNIRQLYLLDVNYYWKKHENKGKTIEIGTYYAGEQCHEKGPITIPDVYLKHKSMIPRESGLTREAMKVMNSLEFKAQGSSIFDLQKKLKRSGGLSLHPMIESLYIDSCYPTALKNKYSKKSRKISDVSAGSFRRHKVQLSVKWVLKDNRDQDVIYERAIVSYYDNINSEPTSAASVVEKAMEHSALRLMADPAFVNFLYVEEDKQEHMAVNTALNGTKVSSNKSKTIELSFNGISMLEGSNAKEVNFGKLLFGPNCTAAKEITWHEMEQMRREVGPKVEALSSTIASEIRSLGYSLREGAGEISSTKDRRAALAVSLHNIHVSMCSPSKDGATKYASISEVKGSSFNRFVVRLELKWMLQHSKGAGPEATIITSGQAGGLMLDNDLPDAYSMAVKVATHSLLSKPEIVEQLSLEQPQVTLYEEASLSEEKAEPIVRDPNVDVEEVLLAFASGVDGWRNVEFDDEVIGFYGVGQNCTPYIDRLWPNTYNEHKGFFPAFDSLTVSLGSLMQRLDYPHRKIQESAILSSQRKNDALKLKFSIIDLHADACAPGIDDDGRSDVHRALFRSERKVKRHRVQVGILWQIIDVNQEPIYEKTTVGHADSWEFDMAGGQTFIEAFTGAAELLFSDQVFVDILIHGATSGSKNGDGLFSKIYNWLNQEI